MKKHLYVLLHSKKWQHLAVKVMKFTPCSQKVI